MRARVEGIVVRRLKRDINAGSDTPRFCTRRPPEALPLATSPDEAAVSTAFDAFGSAVRALVSTGSAAQRRTGAFAVEILGKRLLSCPVAFAESWSRMRQGFATAETTTEQEVAAAERTLRQETGDDREAQQREATAATVAGAWLRNFAGELNVPIHAIERALDTLGFDLYGAPISKQTPTADARFETLVNLIGRSAGREPAFRTDERLIVFTEYKTALDYLARRLREHYPSDRVLTLFGSGGPGGMDQTDREHVKTAFNDPASPATAVFSATTPTGSSWLGLTISSSLAIPGTVVEETTTSQIRALGAETACLIRRLRAFCNADPNETTCVATSATIVDHDDPQAGRNFAARFFGVAADAVATIGEDYEAEVWTTGRFLRLQPKTP